MKQNRKSKFCLLHFPTEKLWLKAHCSNSGINRLQYVINNTGLDRKSCIFEIAESADHTDFAVDVKFFRLFLELYSVHDGHFHICDNNVRMLFENDLQAIFGIICFQKITVCSDLSHGVLNFRIRDMKKLGSRL